MQGWIRNYEAMHLSPSVHICPVLDMTFHDIPISLKWTNRITLYPETDKFVTSLYIFNSGEFIYGVQLYYFFKNQYIVLFWLLLE